MPAYVIVDIRVEDREKFKAYASAVQDTVSRYRGRYLCKWGNSEDLEGDWRANRIVIVEFENEKFARQWWGSDEYRPLKALRRESSTARVMLVSQVL